MFARPAALTASFGFALVLAALASAQSGDSHMLMIEEDDGGTRHVMHMSAPDTFRVREPDYRRDDLPIFRKRLVLDDPQMEVLSALLDEYLRDFETLIAEKLPARRGMQMVQFGGLPFGPGGDPGQDGVFGAAGDIGHLVAGHRGDGDAAHGMGEDVDIDMADGAGEVRVGIQIGAGPGGGFAPPPDMGGDGAIEIAIMSGNDTGEGPVGGVFVGVSGPDGEELPEGLRKELEKKAMEMAEQLQAQLEAAEESGAFVFDEETSPEEHMARMQEQMDEMAAAVRAVEAEKTALAARFENGVMTSITGEQLERWPALDRALVRKKTLPLGRLDGERTDLVAVAEELDAESAAEPSVAERLHEYEIALHGALERRNAFVPKANTKVDEAIGNQEIDKALAVLDRAARLRVAVRDVNELYTEAIANALGEERSGAFRQRVREVSFPRVYGRSLGLRAFEEARQLPDLDEDVLLRILEIEQAYRAELDITNANLQRTIEQHQPQEPRRGIEHLRAMMEGAEGDFPPSMHGDDPVQQAFRARRELDERSMKVLYEILTPEQVATLPKLPSERKRSTMTMFPQLLEKLD